MTAIFENSVWNEEENKNAVGNNNMRRRKTIESQDRFV